MTKIDSSHGRPRDPRSHSGLTVLTLIGIVCFLGCSGCPGCESTKTVEEKSQQAEENDTQPVAETDAKPQPPTIESHKKEDAQTDHPLKPVQQSASEVSSDRTPKTAAAAQAYSQAKRLWSQSQQSANSGNHGEAFIQARDAWKLANQNPDDPASAALAATISAQLGQLGQKANEQNAASTNKDALLIEK